jgi:acetyl-CoA/propionyl-CoA carboxylase biotin carboxyl carrier protein
VQRWIAQDRLPARRVGGRWRVAFDAFDANTLVQGETTNSPIRTLFIANRGEIAARIRRTCDRLAILAIDPPTDGPDAIDLLDAGAVIAAARASGADAIHPGFGFLAENADFAADVIAAGMRWVGPPPDAIRIMGDKAAARTLAARLGIPIPPGYDEPDQRDEAFAAAAEQVGYPILIKPAAGGGGKGMRTVRDQANLARELAAARREAATAFGDERLILERLVEGARHVEIQVLFDASGNGIHLGERDCSIQRRHQKILEESPSPAVDPDIRSRMGQAAMTLAHAVGYTSAGTCEFLLDERGAFTFLEMNTRLQVEHPVTELVYGRDLVADQLRIAAGEPLGLTQDAIALDGHAIEVRLYAEDAEAGFLPSTGRIEHLRWPTGQDVRVDAGVIDGDEVTERFDPMLAKIIARGRDRAVALERLTRALDETLVLGLTTNLRFLRWLVREPAVRGGAARTDTLDRIWPPDDWTTRAALPDEAWSTAAHALAGGSAPDDPWRGGWRLNATASIRLAAGGVVRTVPIDDPSRDQPLEHIRVGETAHVDVAGRSVTVRVAAAPDVDRAARAAAAAHGTGPVALEAPMPGRILMIHGEPGGVVGVGDPVVTLEAMKMEHAVVAPIGGRIAELHVEVGQQVQRGQLLAIVEPMQVVEEP